MSWWWCSCHHQLTTIGSRSVGPSETSRPKNFLCFSSGFVRSATAEAPPSLFSLPQIHHLRSPPPPWDPPPATLWPLLRRSPPMLLLPWSKDVSPRAFSLLMPARSSRAAPAPPHPAAASIHVHTIRDGELCPRGGGCHHRWLLLIAPSYRSDMGWARRWSSAGSEWLQVVVVGKEGQLPPSSPPLCHIPVLPPLRLAVSWACVSSAHLAACGIDSLFQKLDLRWSLASSRTPPVRWHSDQDWVSGHCRLSTW
jgi:hypothetical protein